MISSLKSSRCPTASLQSVWSPPLTSFYSVVVAPASRPPSDHDQSQQDLVGSPSPRSNLRPVRYASLFPPSTIPSDLHLCASPTPVESSSTHPYSLNEFTTQPDLMPQSLAELKTKLALEDLAWTLFRKRIDKSNEAFWATQSTNFEALEDAERSRVLASFEGSEELSVANRQELVDIALDRYYQRWLLNEQTRFRSYTFDWWKVQTGFLRGSWKAQKRVWQWRWACWKIGWKSH